MQNTFESAVAEVKNAFAERRSTTNLSALHESDGWGRLEKSLSDLLSITGQMGSALSTPDIALKLEDAFTEASTHENRFVRQLSFQLMGHAFAAMEPQKALSLWEKMRSPISQGLVDLWGEVRRVACIAACALALAVPADARASVFEVILPRLCLNRHYPADGVKNQAAYSWKDTTQGAGKAWAERFASSFVDLYIDQLTADDSSCEAACHCIAELCGVISYDAAVPHVPRLLKSLTSGFGDCSWVVRDSTAMACSKLVQRFSSESSVVRELDGIAAHWFEHLSDEVITVRVNASRYLGETTRALAVQPEGKLLRQAIMAYLKSHFLVVEEESETLTGPEPRRQFMSAKKAFDNDFKSHTDRAMQACCAPGPKQVKPEAHCNGECDLEHIHSTPWLVSAGCFLLLQELAEDPMSRSDVEQFLPLALQAMKKQNYLNFPRLWTTAFTSLTSIIKTQGIQVEGHMSSLLQFAVESAEVDYRPLQDAVASFRETLFSKILCPVYK